MQSGAQISPNLKLVRPLGQGGMGSVWVADHLGLGTQVAVKVMSRAVASDPQLVARFRREAAAAAQLKSPHVAQVFDHGVTASGEPYIVMELLEGEDAGKRMERLGAQPLPFVLDVIGQAAKALGRAHSVGIVHRDVKPENVFLTEHDGELLVKILDFGIAKTSDQGASVTATHGTFGTPLYMGPEQLLSAKNVDHRADLWALAVLAYFLLTARYPFEGETLGAISVAVHEGRFVPASQRRPGLSAAMDAWFSRSFARDPAARFQSAKEMAEALRAAAVGSSVTAPAVTAPTADPNGIAHLPTSMDASQIGSLPTLAGASMPKMKEPRRRTLVLAGAGVVASALVTLVVLRAQAPASPDPTSGSPAREALSAQAEGPPVTVAPSTASSLPPEPTASATVVVAPSASAIAGAPVSSAKPSTSVATTGAKTPGKPSKPAPTKKDDIGF